MTILFVGYYKYNQIQENSRKQENKGKIIYICIYMKNKKGFITNKL